MPCPLRDTIHFACLSNGLFFGRSLAQHPNNLLLRKTHFSYASCSFERLLLAPIPLETLMLAKTSGAIIFGTINALVPILIVMFFTDRLTINWVVLIPAMVLIAVSSTFLGLFIAVSVKEVFEAQTFSNFFRFPMIFLCGLFFPIEQFPIWLKPLSYVLPLTYGADIHHNSINQAGHLPLVSNFVLLIVFCAMLFLVSLRNIRRKWIL
ncbi:MAG: ABC transporter permease [Sedimentisphaerales bacterium]|nr:ABC transporter permease [Sedimentisphaerales bacterium]